MSFHGLPCWYELSTNEGALDAAGTFYGKVFGWNVTDSGMEGFDYRLAKAGEAMVAGLMVMPQEAGAMPPMWTAYFAVEDIDAAVADMQKAGAKLYVPVTQIPETGRFAILADPQGTGFGVLEPAPMEGGPPAGGAFDQQKTGHGNWHELQSPDPTAAMAFYTGAFGWTASRSVDLGDMGRYDMFARAGADIGGMMRVQPGGPPTGFWLPYFGIESVDAAIGRVKAAGGRILTGPAEVPGGAFIAVAADPQGAGFAMVGPK